MTMAEQYHVDYLRGPDGGDPLVTVVYIEERWTATSGAYWLTGVGIAIRSPLDHFDKKRGRAIAMGRARLALAGRYRESASFRRATTVRTLRAVGVDTPQLLDDAHYAKSFVAVGPYRLPMWRVPASAMTALTGDHPEENFAQRVLRNRMPRMQLPEGPEGEPVHMLPTGNENTLPPEYDVRVPIGSVNHPQDIHSPSYDNEGAFCKCCGARLPTREWCLPF